jgi:REP element-mobilizing transposase RayT
VRHGSSGPPSTLLLPVFVTNYRRPVFTNEILTFCEETMRTVCAELDTELN